jgi:hypothetical protein
MTRVAVSFVVYLCCAMHLRAADEESRPAIESSRVESKIGIEGTYFLRHPSANLLPKPANDDSPVVLRIADVVKDKDSYLYEIRFIGLREGEHDLRDYLTGSQDGPHEISSPMVIVVHAVLPKDHDGAIEDYSAAGKFWAPPYRTLLRAAIVLWGVATCAYLIRRYFFQPAPIVAALSHQPTLADQLLPLVEAGIAGKLTTAGQALLERLLLAHWQQKLQLTALAPEQALRKLRVDPTAGKLLRELEAWLHMRPGTHVVNVPVLLEPYRTAAAIQLEPEANLVADKPVANKEVAAT